MKKIIYITLFLCTSQMAFAQDVQTKPTLPQNRAEIQQKIEEKRENLQTQILQKKEEVKVRIEENREEQRTRLELTAKERVSKALTVIFDRMEAFVVRYDVMIQRISNRLESTESTTTEESRELLEQAKQNLEESTALIAATKTELLAMTQGEISREAIRTNIELCRESLKKTHASLVEVIKSIKGDNIEQPLSIE